MKVTESGDECEKLFVVLSSVFFIAFLFKDKNTNENNLVFFVWWLLGITFRYLCTGTGTPVITGDETPVK